MKKIIFISLLLFSSLNLIAQNWLTDFSEAKQIATSENKTIILVFQGSDWCAPCIKLDREIWSSEEFKTYAEEHYVMLRADFPRRKKNSLSKEQQSKNNVLAEKYNKNGYFPLVVILDNKGNRKGELGYEKSTPSDFINKINKLK
ncbi:MAG: thioredoxin family protein [Flavobacteriaceae bacterium]